MASNSDLDFVRLHNAILQKTHLDSLAYREAVQAAPLLVKRESDPTKFLSFANGDVGVASDLICKYWQERARYFGSRALLPLHLTGQAAFTAEDIQEIRAAPGAVKLPPHSSGCGVLLVDRSRRFANNNNNAADFQVNSPSLASRSLFYFLQQICCIPLSQVGGFHLIVRVHREILDAEEQGDNELLLFARMLSCFPIRVRALHLVAVIPLPPATTSDSIIPLVEARILATKQSWERAIGLEAIFHMSTTSESRVLASLTSMGFDSSSLPRTLGGSWSYDVDHFQDLLAKLNADRQATNASQQPLAITSAPQLNMGQRLASLVRGALNPQGQANGLLLASQQQQEEEQQRQSLADHVLSSSVQPAPAINGPAAVQSSDALRQQLTGLIAASTHQHSLQNNVVGRTDRYAQPASFSVQSSQPANVADLLARNADLASQTSNLSAQTQHLQQPASRGPGISNLSSRSLQQSHSSAASPSNLPIPTAAATVALPPFPHPATSRSSLSTASIGSSLSRDEDSLPDQSRMRDGLYQLDEAIKGLPESQTRAYFQAQRECPELVESESTPIWFLSFERYDLWAAARRLTTYWDWRVRLFKERAFLPITITGDGALSRDDIIHVRRGYFTIIPNDSDGASVICYDPSRRAHHCKDTRMRVGFYFWHVMTLNEKTRKDGWVGFVLLGTSGFTTSSLDGAIRECGDMVFDSFPLKLKNLHLVQCIRPGGPRTLLKMLMPVLKFVMARLMDTSVTHVADTAEKLIESLSKYGLRREGVPKSAGGTWSYDKMYSWQLERINLERAILRRKHYRPATPNSQQGVIGDNERVSTSPQPLTPQSNPAGLNEDPFSTIDGITLLEDINSLPEQDKASFLRALQQCPDLVRNESNPHRFLECDKHDSAASARRLALYWQYRCSLFGDKAMLPLVQTGEGALTRPTMTALSSGCISVLPTLSNEPSVICYDLTKQTKLDSKALSRVAFYILQVVSENKRSQAEGVVIIATGILQAQTNKVLLDFVNLLGTIPITVSVIHFTHLYSSEDDNKGSLDESLKIVRKKFGPLGDEKGLLHVGHSTEELCTQLEAFGIRKDILPKHVGGNFGYDRFVQWQELRTRFEWGLPAGAKDQDASDMYDFSRVKPLAELPPEERKERKRRMNVVHSRRKRERERIEIEVLQEQCTDLRQTNYVLRQDRQRLEGLLQGAERILSGFLPGKTPQG